MEMAGGLTVVRPISVEKVFMVLVASEIGMAHYENGIGSRVYWVQTEDNGVMVCGQVQESVVTKTHVATSVFSKTVPASIAETNDIARKVRRDVCNDGQAPGMVVVD